MKRYSPQLVSMEMQIKPTHILNLSATRLEKNDGWVLWRVGSPGTFMFYQREKETLPPFGRIFLQHLSKYEGSISKLNNLFLWICPVKIIGSIQVLLMSVSIELFDISKKKNSENHLKIFLNVWKKMMGCPSNGALPGLKGWSRNALYYGQSFISINMKYTHLCISVKTTANDSISFFTSDTSLYPVSTEIYREIKRNRY